jgi:hypothetical protein
MSWTEEFMNALAWFVAAPANAKNNMKAAAEWMWEVLQGDFAEDPSTAQIVTGTVIAMIPIVDQICDVRDLVANSKKIYEAEDGESTTWYWVAFTITLVGLVPILGSLFKGFLKILFKYLRNMLHTLSGKTVDDFWNMGKPFVEAGIAKFNEHLAKPTVKKVLSKLRIDNPYKATAEKIREAYQTAPEKLLEYADALIKEFRKMVIFIRKHTNVLTGIKVRHMWRMVLNVRKKAKKKVAEVFKPTQDFLERLAQRLDVEQSQVNRAVTNTVNPHTFARLNLEAEIAVFRKKKPSWVYIGTEARYPALEEAPPPKALYPDLGGRHENFKTFHTIEPVLYPPGSRLVRVVDSNSRVKGDCWIEEEIFKKVRSKDEWRQRFAVWTSWNGDGEYVVYTVPPEGLRAWRGKTASQQLKYGDSAPAKHAKGEAVLAGNHETRRQIERVEQGKVRADNPPTKEYFWTEGGWVQTIVAPADLRDEYLSKRQLTGWGGETAPTGGSNNLVGIPQLTKKKE